jgi:hypothetical protein
MKYRIELTSEERDELGNLLEHVNVKYGEANGAIHARIMNALRSASPVGDLVGKRVKYTGANGIDYYAIVSREFPPGTVFARSGYHDEDEGQILDGGTYELAEAE